MVSFKGLPKGSTRGVDLAVLVYDNAKFVDPKQNEVTAVYANAQMHPDSQLAEGQRSLSLSTRKDDKGKYNSNVRYTPKQIEAMGTAAGDNTAPLLDKDGGEVGKIYGVKGDVFFNNGQTVINTKSIEKSDLSVAPVEVQAPQADGTTAPETQDIQKRIYSHNETVKAAREAAQAAAPETPAAEAGAEAPAQAEETSEQKIARLEAQLDDARNSGQAEQSQPGLG